MMAVSTSHRMILRMHRLSRQSTSTRPPTKDLALRSDPKLPAMRSLISNDWATPFPTPDRIGRWGRAIVTSSWKSLRAGPVRHARSARYPPPPRHRAGGAGAPASLPEFRLSASVMSIFLRHQPAGAEPQDRNRTAFHSRFDASAPAPAWAHLRAD